VGGGLTFWIEIFECAFNCAITEKIQLFLFPAAASTRGDADSDAKASDSDGRDADDKENYV
jgi:hypothetical protein